MGTLVQHFVETSAHTSVSTVYTCTEEPVSQPGKQTSTMRAIHEIISQAHVPKGGSLRHTLKNSTHKISYERPEQ